jgi:hypothetical protein
VRHTSRATSGRRRSIAALGGALLVSGAIALMSEGGASAGVVDAGAPIVVDASTKIPPDPPALSERMQWVFDLRWERGEVYLLEIHQVDMGTSHPTPRMMGRFALELYEGPTLIERTRFDFPMLGAVEPADAGWKTPSRFGARLKTRIGVIFPATKRGTRLELWDRALDRRWPLPWPPHEGVYTDGPRDASPDDIGAGLR